MRNFAHFGNEVYYQAIDLYIQVIRLVISFIFYCQVAINFYGGKQAPQVIMHIRSDRFRSSSCP